MKAKAICILFISILIWETESGFDWTRVFHMRGSIDKLRKSLTSLKKTDFSKAFDKVIAKLKQFQSNESSFEDGNEYAKRFEAANIALATFGNGPCKVLEELNVALLDQHYILKLKILDKRTEEIIEHLKLEGELPPSTKYDEWFAKMNIVGSNFEKLQYQAISAKNEELSSQIYNQLTKLVVEMRKDSSNLSTDRMAARNLFLKGYLIVGDIDFLFYEVALIYFHDEIKNLEGSDKTVFSENLLIQRVYGEALTDSTDRGWIPKQVDIDIGTYVEAKIKSLNSKMKSSSFETISRGMCHLYYNIIHNSYKNKNGNYQKVSQLYTDYLLLYKNLVDHESYKMVMMAHVFFKRMTESPRSQTLF